MAWLLLLYTLQGVPMGMSMSLPLLLKDAGFGFASRGLFATAAWPYSLKMIWAPLVDAVWWPRLGRRRSWVVPVQILLGILLLVSGPAVDAALRHGQAEDAGLSSSLLFSMTALFFVFYALVATQDIAVDGWALTMLPPDKVEFASTANTVGQTLGSLLAYQGLIALTSPEFANRWVRAVPSPDALVSLGQFMQAAGVMFIVVTLAITVCIPEPLEYPGQASLAVAAAVKPSAQADGPATVAITSAKSRARTPTRSQRGRAPLGEAVDASAPASRQPARAGCACRAGFGAIARAYHQTMQLLQLRSVQLLALLLLTGRFAFAGFDNGRELELLERGMPKSSIAGRNLFLTPLSLGCTVLLSNWARGAGALQVWIRAAPLRLAVLGLYMAVVRHMHGGQLEFGQGYTLSCATTEAIFSALEAVYSCTQSAMFVAQMAWFSRVADPRMGGSYMTALNTLANLGNMWPTTPVLVLMSKLQQHTCVLHDKSMAAQVAQGHVPGHNGTAVVDMAAQLLDSQVVAIPNEGRIGPTVCKAAGGEFVEVVDGFSIVVTAAAVLGVLWVMFAWPIVQRLAGMPLSAWRLADLQGEEQPSESNEAAQRRVEAEPADKTASGPPASTPGVTHRKGNNEHA